MNSQNCLFVKANIFFSQLPIENPIAQSENTLSKVKMISLFPHFLLNCSPNVIAIYPM
jgi:hypothetical protein